MGPHEGPRPPALCLRRASGPIVVDGRLDEAAWQNAPWTEDFVDIEGEGKPRPRYRTRAKCSGTTNTSTWRRSGGAERLGRTLTRHDSVIFNDPDFEVFMDPDGDAHDYYEFEMNASTPAGTFSSKNRTRTAGRP